MAPRFNASAPSMTSGQCMTGRHDSCVGRFGQGKFWVNCACPHHAVSLSVTRVMSASPTYGCTR